MARSTADGDPKSPWAQPWFVVAAGVLTIAVVVAVVIAVTGPGERGSAAPKAAAPPVVDAPAAERASACGLPDGDQAVPSAAPSARWELVGSMAAPTAPRTVGPARTDAGFRLCFARSPLGALFASVSLWATATAEGGADLFERLAVPSPERDRAVSDAREQGNERLDTTARSKLQVAGFTFLSYNARTAVVDLAFRLSNGSLFHWPSTMRWVDGDWLYVIPQDGNPHAGPLPDLAGYVAWSGA